MEPITKEEYEGWLQDPVTKKVVKQFENKSSNIQQDLALGMTLDEDCADRTAILTAKAVGKIEGINEIFKIDVE